MSLIILLKKKHFSLLTRHYFELKIPFQLLDDSIHDSNQVLVNSFLDAMNKNIMEPIEKDIINGIDSDFEPEKPSEQLLGILPFLNSDKSRIFSVDAEDLSTQKALQELSNSPLKLCNSPDRRDGIFVMSRESLKKLMDAFPIGTTEIIKNGIDITIKGHKIIDSDSFPKAEKPGNPLFIFFNPKNYFLVIQEDITLEKTIVESDEAIYYKLIIKCDGAPKNPEAFICGIRT